MSKIYNNRNMRAQYQCKLEHVPTELANLFDLAQHLLDP